MASGGGLAYNLHKQEAAHIESISDRGAQSERAFKACEESKLAKKGFTVHLEEVG